MAAGNFTPLNVAKLKYFNQVVKLNSDAFKVALTTSSFAAATTYTGTSANAQYSDLSAVEVTGTGYTAGGQSTTTTLTANAGVVTFNGTGVSWPSSTITAKYAVVYDNTSTNKDIVGYMDLETTQPSGISSTNGTFTVNFNASGLFTVS